MDKPEGKARGMYQPSGRPYIPPGDGTPQEIVDSITWTSREPLELAPRAAQPVGGTPVGKHRLVVIGDSISQGFKSFAIHQTDLSWPAMVARYGGIETFRRPQFDGPQDCPGLPLNLEALVRSARVPATLLDTRGVARLARDLLRVADRVEDYWERSVGGDRVAAAGEPVLDPDKIHHNLAVWGHDIRDALDLTVRAARRRIRDAPGRFDNLFRQVPSAPMERTTLLTLDPGRPDDSQVSLAKKLGEDGGIETLVIALGANNILRTVLSFRIDWSEDGAYQDLESKQAFNAWAPRHFEVEFNALLEEVDSIKAKNVIVFTVPHVTIAPMVRGVGTKMPGDRYFSRYTRPWIPDEIFNPNRHDCLTGQQLRILDCAVDMYNEHIVSRVGSIKSDKTWRVLDTAGMLDRMAYRRYVIDDEATPPWWEPYDLPEAYRALSPGLDSRFFRSDKFGRIEGGLFSLDGIHPTTAGYALLAHEVMLMMTDMGVPLAAVEPDWEEVLRLDSLISDPPQNLATVLTVIEILDRGVDLFAAATADQKGQERRQAEAKGTPLTP